MYVNSVKISMLVCSASTLAFLRRWLSSRSLAGKNRSTAICMPTGRTAWSSIRARKWSRLAGNSELDLIDRRGELHDARFDERDAADRLWQDKYAVGQFNLNNLEFTQAILQAAQQEQAPVILGVSEAYIPYMGGLPCIVGMVKSLIEHYGITVPVALHLDHGTSYDLCIRAIHAGFTSVMIDASHHSLEHNIEVTRQVTQAAHVLGVSVESELGRITGREDDLVVDEAEGMYAVAEDCVRLVKETGIDCLAPALGSVHGPYRGQPKLGFDRMAEIRTLTGLPLVLHGGSGLPDDEIRQAIRLRYSQNQREYR